MALKRQKDLHARRPEGTLKPSGEILRSDGHKVN